MSKSNTVFHASKVIRSIIKKSKNEFSWPPAPEDLDESNLTISVLAYNMLAWMLTESSEFSD